MRGYTLTVRSGARVRRERFGSPREALDALERRGRELESGAGPARVGGRLLRRIDPVQQELSGPRRLRVGVDIRGDGSVEGFTGRTRRRLVEQRGGESAYDALRRTLRDGA